MAKKKPIARNIQEQRVFDYIDSLDDEGKENFLKVLEGMRDGTVSIDTVTLPDGWGVITFHDEPQEPENHLLLN